MRPVIPLRWQGNIGDRAQGNGNEELSGGTGDSTAQLSNHPRTLLFLWHAYLHSLGNNKAAKDFTREERGGAKQKYSKRKIFWDLMCNLLRAGFTELAAIDKIRQAYGTNRSVSYVLLINKIRGDKRRGGILTCVFNVCVLIFINLWHIRFFLMLHYRYCMIATYFIILNIDILTCTCRATSIFRE